MANSHQPFHQKYRPNSLDELVGQELINITLKQALTTNKIAPAYLFNGPRGTGKTSSARILAKSLNCLAYDQPHITPCNSCDLCNSISDGTALDIIEIDAASNTGVENVREIIERSNFAPTQARWKVYVIDECHMLSTAASNALLKTIEEPPEKVVFILATTNPERVLDTIQSRCQRFDFKRINTQQIYKHLQQISQKESIQIEEDAIKLIAKRSNGGMRDAQSLLDQLSLIPNGITKKRVEELLGEVSESELITIIESLILNDPESLIQNCCKLYDAGNEPISILEGLLSITRDLLLKTIQNKYSDLFHTSQEFQPKLEQLAQSINKSKIIKWHNDLKNSEYQIKNSNQPRLWLEIHLTSLLEINEQKNEKINSPNNNNFKKDQNLNLEEKLVNTNEKSEIIVNDESSLNKSSETKMQPSYEDTNYNLAINLKEKWSLILSKLELPSTRMLLSQQAELLDIQSDYIEIGISPNWENMIKSRKVVIENAVKKIFGEHIKINFSTKRNSNQNIKNSSEPKSIKDNDLSKNLNVATQDSKPKPDKKNIFEQNSSKNLADFFNGEILDNPE
tara:strand:- start:1217 stop:2920 length:1704 start_codon:yes stop_codon:yes gene_type:complete